jgi:hypothetical protein
MSASVMQGWVIGFLVEQQMVEQAVGFVRGMEDGEDTSVPVTVIGPVERLRNGRAVTG